MAGRCLVLLTALLFVSDSPSAAAAAAAAAASEDADFEGSNTATARAAVGETAFLTCRIPDKGDQHVWWERQKTSEIMLGHRRSLSARIGRLTASCSKDGDECLLMISDVQKSDSGLYLCADDSTQQIRRSVYLSVFEPMVTILGEPFSAHWQGSAINLTCLVSPGRESGDIQWLHGDSVLHTFQDPRLTITTEIGRTIVSQLQLEDAQPKDSGTYTCRLTRGGSDSVEVDVMEVVSDDFSPMVSGAQQPLRAVSAAVLLALGASTSYWC